VVAVFSREDFDEELPEAGIVDGQHSSGGGRGYNPISSPGPINPGVSFDDFDFPRQIIPGSPGVPGLPGLPEFPDIPDIPDIPDEIPVPGDNDDIPVPGDNEVPEPATIFLLGIGSSVLLKRRSRQKMN
jgi:hypothetical protein